MASKHLEYARWISVMKKLDNKLKNDFLERKSKKSSNAKAKKEEK